MPLPKFIAHRGAGLLAPENTLAAFQLGAAWGHTAFECDVKLSADDVCFLLHDDTLERTTSGLGLAAQHSWETLSQLDAGSWLSRKYRHVKPASLAEIAHWCMPRGYAVNLEIKPTPGADEHTGHVVAHAAAELWGNSQTQLLLSSFSAQALKAAQQTQPQLARAHLFSKLPNNWLQQVLALACEGVVLHHALITPQTIAMCHDQGWWCAAYTVNDRPTVEQFLSWGVNHIITDAVDVFNPGFLLGESAVD